MVASVVLNNNKILLIQQSDKSSSLLWNLPFSTVEEGWGLSETVIALTLSQTGFNVKVLKLIKIQNYLNSRKEQNIKFVYLTEVINGSIQKNDLGTKDIQWISLDEILQMPDDKLSDPIRLKTILYFVNEQKFYPLELIKDL